MDREPMRRPIGAREVLWLSPFLLGYAAYGLLSARFGFAADPDSQLIWRSAGALLDGRYVPSRTSGFPAYEAFVALLRGIGADPVTVAVATIGLGIAAFVLAIACTARPEGRLAVAILFSASPAIVSNASSLMETNLALATVALFLWFHLKLSALPGDPGPRLAVAVALAGLVVALSRLDAAIVVAASLGALFATRRRPVYLVILAAAGVASFVSYWLLRGNLGFLGFFLISDDPLGRSIAKAGFGAVALLWTAGLTAVAVLFANRRQLRPEVAVFVVAVTTLYAVRFVILPLEVEYLLPLHLVLIVVAACTVNRRQLAWVAPAAIAGMLAQPQLFVKPSALSDDYRLAPSLGPPGILTDLQDRAEVNVAAREDYWLWLERQVGTPLRRHGGNGFVISADRRVLVIFEDAAHLFVSARWQRHAPSVAAYDQVVLCSIARTQNMGWRQLRQPFSTTSVAEFVQGRPLRCETLHGPLDRERYIEAAHRVWPGA